MEDYTDTDTNEENFGKELAQTVVATVAVTAAMYGTIIAAGYISYKLDARRKRKEEIDKILIDFMNKTAEKSA